MTNSSDWYLATSKPRQENRAVENLKNQGIKGYSPVIKLEKVRGGKKQIVEEPMFTGYLFINLSPEDPKWQKVRSTRGVRDWVKFSGSTAKLPQALIDSLIDAENSQLIAFDTIKLQKGDSVRILSGPFEGLNGVFLTDNGEKRAMILVDFLGKQSRLNVAKEQIIGE